MDDFHVIHSVHSFAMDKPLVVDNSAMWLLLVVALIVAIGWLMFRDLPRKPTKPQLLFKKHKQTCAQCRGDTANWYKGGPPPLCEEGFKLLKADLRGK